MSESEGKPHLRAVAPDVQTMSEELKVLAGEVVNAEANAILAQRELDRLEKSIVETRRKINQLSGPIVDLAAARELPELQKKLAELVPRANLARIAQDQAVNHYASLKGLHDEKRASFERLLGPKEQ